MFELNNQQGTAVAHRGGPLLVQAGAGTGKTGTLAGEVSAAGLRGPPGGVAGAGLGAGHLFSQVSRFLSEEVRALMDTEELPMPIPRSAGDSSVLTETGGMETVDRFLSSLWA
jgi:hypothetical protein